MAKRNLAVLAGVLAGWAVLCPGFATGAFAQDGQKPQLSLPGKVFPTPLSDPQDSGRKATTAGQLTSRPIFLDPALQNKSRRTIEVQRKTFSDFGSSDGAGAAAPAFSSPLRRTDPGFAGPLNSSSQNADTYNPVGVFMSRLTPAQREALDAQIDSDEKAIQFYNTVVANSPVPSTAQPLPYILARGNIGLKPDFQSQARLRLPASPAALAPLSGLPSLDAALAEEGGEKKPPLAPRPGFDSIPSYNFGSSFSGAPSGETQSRIKGAFEDDLQNDVLQNKFQSQDQSLPGFQGGSPAHQGGRKLKYEGKDEDSAPATPPKLFNRYD